MAAVGRKLFEVSFIRALVLFVRALFSCLQKASRPNAITLGVKLQHVYLEDTKTFSP